MTRWRQFLSSWRNKAGIIATKKKPWHLKPSGGSNMWKALPKEEPVTEWTTAKVRHQIFLLEAPAHLSPAIQHCPRQPPWWPATTTREWTDPKVSCRKRIGTYRDIGQRFALTLRVLADTVKVINLIQIPLKNFGSTSPEIELWLRNHMCPTCCRKNRHLSPFIWFLGDSNQTPARGQPIIDCESATISCWRSIGPS